MNEGKTVTLFVAHDYLCPWCWIGFFQAQRLVKEFPQVRLDWHGYELLPEELGPLPDYKPAPPDPSAPLSRMHLLAQTEGVPLLTRSIGIVRTHNPLEGAEYFKEHHPEQFDIYNEAVYRAFWEKSEDISDIGLLTGIAEKSGADGGEFADAISGKAYQDRIVPYDDAAYAANVYYVPTFRFRGEQCAEAPYSTIRDMMMRHLAHGK